MANEKFEAGEIITDTEVRLECLRLATEFGPEFAIEKIPGTLCFRFKALLSQGICQPGPPVPARRDIGSLECGHPPWIIKFSITR